MSYKSDYSKAVFLNAYGSGKPLKQNSEYQQYIKFECEITNPRKYHKQLIAADYLQPASPEKIISSLKVSELKEICESIGVQKTGKKQILVERIISSCSPDQITFFVKEPLYSLSAKGELFLNEHWEYVELHKHKNYGISLDEYVSLKNSLPFTSTFRDVAWGIFNKRILDYSKNKQYGLLRSNYLNMSQLSKEEKNYDVELKFLLYVLFFDIYDYDMEYISYQTTREKAINCYRCFAFQTSIPGRISELKEYYDEIYADEVYQSYSGQFPIVVCDINTFKHLVIDLFDSTENINQKYVESFERNFTCYVDVHFRQHKEDVSSHVDSNQKPKGCLSNIAIICFLIYILSIIQ